MKEFTLNARFWTVRHCKRFKAFKKYVLAPRGDKLMVFRKIKRLNAFYNVDPKETVKVLNAMQKGFESGKYGYRALSHKTAGLYSFLIGENKPFVLVLAGGGYGDVCSVIEAFPTAVKLNEMGYNAFVGQYRVGKQAIYPNPLDDVAEMVRLIFKDAAANKVSTQNYAVCGFSAGGHLAALWGTQTFGWAKYKTAKPGAIWLCYPVITMGEFTHTGSRDRFLGKNASPQKISELSAENAVDKTYPKTFIWQCVNDDEVPFCNSQLMQEALKNNGCECELLAVDYNKHGLGLGTGTPAEGWIQKAAVFWQK